MRLRMIGSEALRSITANLSTTVAATVTVLIGMFLVGLLIAFGTWARSWSDHTKDKLVVKVFFCTESTCDKARTDKQIDSVRVLLESNPKVKSETFVSKEKALERMKKQNPDLVKDLASTGRVSIIVIDHNYAHLFELCDRINVMQGGRITTDQSVQETSLEELTELMVSSYRRQLDEVSGRGAVGGAR